MKKLSINEGIFRQAFNRDVDYHDAYAQSAYLDRRDGDILWAYDEDEQAYWETGISPEYNRAVREDIDAAPENYVEIPGLSHGEHHEILRMFLNSDWTENKEEKEYARSAYFRSIGGWLKTVNHTEAINAYYAFRDHKTMNLAEEFLRKHGIEPQWK